jgi:spore maturation protein CgeB
VIADNMYPSRARQLDRLIAKGIPLRQHSGGFPRWVSETAIRAASIGGYVARERKARVFRSAARVLNIMPPAEISGVNARPLETAGCGAAVITEFRPAVPELSAIGKEVSAVHDFDDLLEQAAKLPSERGLTARLSATAARRAHRDHTYDLRVTTIQAKLS